ncbi:protein kinase [Candidatus Woesearchaeota archaeon]|nr:protein kinase [Candidatus Woesearchaeota archaeon]
MSLEDKISRKELWLNELKKLQSWLEEFAENNKPENWLKRLLEDYDKRNKGKKFTSSDELSEQLPLKKRISKSYIRKHSKQNYDANRSHSSFDTEKVDRSVGYNLFQFFQLIRNKDLTEHPLGRRVKFLRGYKLEEEHYVQLYFKFKEHFASRGLTEKKLGQYHKHFSVRDIINLYMVEDYEPKIANQYAENFNTAVEAMQLIKDRCPLDIALKYNPRFNGIERARLFKTGCLPEEANEYYKKLKGDILSDLYLLGVNNENFNIKMQKRFHNLLSDFIPGIYRDHSSEKSKAKFIASGFNAMIVQIDYGMGSDKPNEALKISEKILKERRLHERLQLEMGYRKENLRNVIRCHGTYVRNWDENEALRLEYIEGETLERILVKKGALDEKTTILHVKDILHGLEELRKAGIYHSDIHDKNIMVDYVNRRTLIIDLGEATTEPHEINKGNRRYGGNNDLISLGQLIYKMYTGHNLFHEKPGITSDLDKEEIRREREETYASPIKKGNMLAKVRQDLPKELGKITATMLDDDLWTQPDIGRVKKVQQMLEKYAK